MIARASPFPARRLATGLRHARRRLQPAANFDDCLITHMAAITMLEDATTEEDANLRTGVIKSQTMLLADDTLEDDAQAARNASLLQSYGRAAERAVAEAYAINTAPQLIAAEAIFCGQELTE